MIATATKIELNEWVKATWDEYLQVEENPDYEKAKIYYYQEKIRIEMSPLGNDHASDHSIIITAINLYNILKGINFNCKDNCNYRKTGYKSAQPDLSYYIGDKADAIPYNTGVVNLDIYPAPNLVIEIANTSLLDDLGNKRLLYENFGCEEYWIVDVKNQKIIAFGINDGGSKQITKSEILSNLELKILEEALAKTRQQNHTKVGAWLLQQFQ
jgi:Uma2 family endonuclease